MFTQTQQTDSSVHEYTKLQKASRKCENYKRLGTHTVANYLNE